MLLQRRGGAPEPQEEPTPLLLLLWAGEAGGDTWKGLCWAERVVVFLRGGGGGGGDLMSTRVVWRPLAMEEVGLGGGWRLGGRDWPKQLITRGDSGALWVLSTPRRFSSSNLRRSSASLLASSCSRFCSLRSSCSCCSTKDSED